MFPVQPWLRQTWRRWLFMRLKTTKCSSGLKRRSQQNHTRLKKKEKRKMETTKLSTISVCGHLIVFLFCSGGPLQSRGLSLVGLFSTHPFRSWYPTMHLWRPEDFWVSGSYCLFNVIWLLKYLLGSLFFHLNSVVSFILLTTVMNANLLLRTPVYKTVPPCVKSWKCSEMSNVCVSGWDKYM